MAARASRSSPPPAQFSPIIAAPARVGEDEPPPSWDPVPTPPAVMVGKGSPRLNMIGRVSPKHNRFLPITSAIKKKSAGSPKAKNRASWNPDLEKSLVEILLEHKDIVARGDNGCWSSDGWTKMIKEFHTRNRYVNFSRNQIQKKEGQLKRDYKMLKESRRQSGSTWNEKRYMVEGSSSMWDNLEVTFLKIKKFRSNKASFPLFVALGELYDGHLTEGNYNCTSLGEEEEPLRQVYMEEDIQEGAADVSVDDRQVADVSVKNNELLTSREEQAEASSAARLEQERRRRKDEQEEKRSKKSSRIESMMENYLEMRTKQVEDERSQLSKEKEAAQGDDLQRKKRKEKRNALNVLLPADGLCFVLCY